MITRIWHGTTSLENSDEYLEKMKTVALPDYRSTPGNLERTIPFIRFLACHFDFPCLPIVLPAGLIPNSNQLRPLQ